MTQRRANAFGYVFYTDTAPFSQFLRDADNAFYGVFAGFRKHRFLLLHHKNKLISGIKEFFIFYFFAGIYQVVFGGSIGESLLYTRLG
ncbi:MAG: hypothetical protein V4649_09175 [Bacteroidota bacterium]